MITILLLLALLAPPTPPLTARWESPGVARVSWSGAGCLWIDQALYRCYDDSGVLRLGGPQTDYAYRPRVESVFRLVRQDGSIERAVLGSLLYFPMFKTSERAPMAERVWMAVWR